MPRPHELVTRGAPKPLSARAAGVVAAAMEAGSRAESFVIVNGSDLRRASVAVMSARSWRSTGLPLVRASQGLLDFARPRDRWLELSRRNFRPFVEANGQP